MTALINSNIIDVSRVATRPWDVMVIMNSMLMKRRVRGRPLAGPTGLGAEFEVDFEF